MGSIIKSANLFKKSIPILIFTSVFTLSIFVSSLTSFSIKAESAEDITTGLNSWWKFNETSGLTANNSSTNNISGFLGGDLSTTGWEVDDIPTCYDTNLSALNFDGLNDVVAMGPSASLHTSSVSVAAWLNINEPTVVQDKFIPIVGNDQKNINNTYGYNLAINYQTNTIRFVNSQFNTTSEYAEFNYLEANVNNKALAQQN